MAYKAYITKLTNVTKDPKSDNLYTAQVMGEGVIVGGDAKEGQKVIYFPADGKIMRSFGNRFGLFRKNEDGTPQGGYLGDNGHIKALKLRGLRSEGITIPVEKIIEAYGANCLVGLTELDSLNGEKICEKYIPHRQHSEGGGSSKKKVRGKKAAGVIYPEFEEHVDTAQLAYSENAFFVGDLVNISLKMHGTSQRSALTKAILPNNFWRRLFRMKPREEYRYVLGTRRVIVTPEKEGGSYYGSNAFRVPHHLAMQRACNPDMEIYYEVVGWVNETTPIMPFGNTADLKDKKLVKIYGEQMRYLYGCEPGESKAFIYRITQHGIEYRPWEIEEFCKQHGLNCVPYIDTFVFSTWQDLLDRINKYFEDLTDPIGKTHIKEGVVVRRLGVNKFSAFKQKTYEFKVLEGLIKEAATEADMEEAQE